MEQARIVQRVLAGGVVAIMRQIDATRIPQVAAALLAGGIATMEVTMETEGAEEAIGRLRKNNDVLMGAGTVLDVPTLHRAVAAGAQFIVTPNFDPAVVAAAHTAEVPIIPGVMTPSEAMAAYRAGARMVKVFPAATLGPAYFKLVRSPLPFLPMMATGGVDVANATEFLKAGAACLGVGGSLVAKDLVAAGDYDEITRRAAALMAAVNLGRA